MKSKLTRREFLRVSALTGVGAALAACAPAATPTPAPPTAAPTAVPTKKPIKLTLWIADRRTINDMTTEVMKSEFQKANPHLSVEVNFIPEGDIPAKMATSFQAGLMPNISALDESQVPGLMKQGFLKPIPPEVFDVAKQMGKKAAAFYKIAPGPAYYALPNGNMPCVMYVNIDLLTKLGYKLEQIPNKWDDFIKWAQSVTV